jgi:hypothetical protein
MWKQRVSEESRLEDRSRLLMKEAIEDFLGGKQDDPD